MQERNGMRTAFIEIFATIKRFTISVSGAHAQGMRSIVSLASGGAAAIVVN
jgi:hypothetical protein